MRIWSALFMHVANSKAASLNGLRSVSGRHFVQSFAAHFFAFGRRFLLSPSLRVLLALFVVPHSHKQASTWCVQGRCCSGRRGARACCIRRVALAVWLGCAAACRCCLLTNPHFSVCHAAFVARCSRRRRRAACRLSLSPSLRPLCLLPPPSAAAAASPSSRVVCAGS